MQPIKRLVNGNARRDTRLLRAHRECKGAKQVATLSLHESGVWAYDLPVTYRDQKRGFCRDGRSFRNNPRIISVPNSPLACEIKGK